MWGLIHIKGCGGVCYFRSSKPFTYTIVDEKDSFNLDGSPVKRTQNLICQSCGKPLALSEVHPDNWIEIE